MALSFVVACSPPVLAEPVPPTVRQAQEDAPSLKHTAPDELVRTDNLEDQGELARKIWATPLGHMYSEYLFADGAANDNVRRVNALIRRLYDDGLLAMNRVSALYLMTIDLYKNGQLTSTVNERIGLLNTIMTLKNHEVDRAVSRGMAWKIPAFLLFGIFAGSTVVRNQAKAVVSFIKHSLFRRLPMMDRAGEAALARAARARINLRRIFSKEFKEDYSYGTAALSTWAAWQTVIPPYFNMRTGKVDNTSPTQKTFFYNVERVIDLSDL